MITSSMLSLLLIVDVFHSPSCPSLQMVAVCHTLAYEHPWYPSSYRNPCVYRCGERR